MEGYRRIQLKILNLMLRLKVMKKLKTLGKTQLLKVVLLDKKIRWTMKSKPPNKNAKRRSKRSKNNTSNEKQRNEKQKEYKGLNGRKL